MKRAILCMYCVLLSFLILMTSAQGATLDEFMKKANEFLAGHISVGAFWEICNEAIKKDAAQNKVYLSKVYAFRSSIYWAAEYPRKAHEDVEKALELDSENMYAYFFKGIILRSEGKPFEAAGLFEEAAKYAADEHMRSGMVELAANTRLEGKIITAISLRRAFEENELAAEAHYKDKIIFVQGKINTISTNAAGNPQISLRAGEYEQDQIVFEFNQEARPGLLGLKKGQTILISGTCAGMSRGKVYLKDSRILE